MENFKKQSAKNNKEGKDNGNPEHKNGHGTPFEFIYIAHFYPEIRCSFYPEYLQKKQKWKPKTSGSNPAKTISSKI